MAWGGVEGGNLVNHGLEPASHLIIIVPVTDLLPLSSKFILQYLLGGNGQNSFRSFLLQNIKHNEIFSGDGAGNCKRQGLHHRSAVKVAEHLVLPCPSHSPRMQPPSATSQAQPRSGNHFEQGPRPPTHINALTASERSIHLTTNCSSP